MEHLEMKIGVVGLGSMGYGIASSLLRSGHQVYGVDVNPDVVRRAGSGNLGNGISGVSA
jgi:3-hydroxyisobutyrate dehydrogenase-like beta-hydroxyacid dehydrogenase